MFIRATLTHCHGKAGWAGPLDTGSSPLVHLSANVIGEFIAVATPHPAIHRNIYSDDHGATWQVQRITDAATGEYQEPTSESTILELLDGRLLRNDRAITKYWNDAKRRWLARGTIESGFDTYAPDDTLLDPRAEASILRYTADPSRIVFLNSASTVTRTKMMIRISYDEARTWPVHRSLAEPALDPQRRY